MRESFSGSSLSDAFSTALGTDVEMTNQSKQNRGNRASVILVRKKPETDSSEIDNESRSFRNRMIEGVLASRQSYIQSERNKGKGLKPEDHKIFGVQLSHMLNLAKTFETTIIEFEGIRNQKIGMRHLDKLSLVREEIGGEFIDTVKAFLSELQNMIMNVANKMEASGMEYMAKGSSVSKEYSDDMRDIMDKMREGYVALNRVKLTGLSRDFKQTTSIQKQDLVNGDVVAFEKDPETTLYRKESESMIIIKRLLESDAEPEVIKNQLLKLLKTSLERMGEYIVPAGQSVLNRSEQRQRISSIYSEIPLMRLELLFGTTVRSVRSMMNLAFLDSVLISREEASSENQAVAV